MRDPYRNLDVATLHQLAREAREHMTPDQIAHAARVGRANMRLTMKLKKAWRDRVRYELDRPRHESAPRGYMPSPRFDMAEG